MKTSNLVSLTRDIERFQENIEDFINKKITLILTQLGFTKEDFSFNVWSSYKGNGLAKNYRNTAVFAELRYSLEHLNSESSLILEFQIRNSSGFFLYCGDTFFIDPCIPEMLSNDLKLNKEDIKHFLEDLDKLINTLNES